ncbi:MAG TPA: hypothetical protein VKA70_03035 [Blastocatellia bacterium]|nr:hypothetical protein [Blastocatellia bacterium]
MRIILSTLKKVLFWSYERGSWQYDVMCVLILLFIFAFPNRFLHTAKTMDAGVSFQEPIFVSREEVGQIDSARLDEVIGEHLARKYGQAVKIERTEPHVDSSGNVTGYLAWGRKE